MRHKTSVRYVKVREKEKECTEAIGKSVEKWGGGGGGAWVKMDSFDFSRMRPLGFLPRLVHQKWIYDDVELGLYFSIKL